MSLTLHFLFTEHAQGRKRPLQGSPILEGRHYTTPTEEQPPQGPDRAPWGHGGVTPGGSRRALSPQNCHIDLHCSPHSGRTYRSPQVSIPVNLPLTTFANPNNKLNNSPRLTPIEGQGHSGSNNNGDSVYVAVASPTVGNLHKCTRTCCNGNNGGRDADDDDAAHDDKASDGESTTTSGSYVVDPETQSVSSVIQHLPQTAATSVA